VENKRSVNFYRFGLGDAGCPIDSRIGDLCNHVGFTDVAAPRSCWRLLEQNKSQDSRLREGAYIFGEKRAKTDLLYLKFNSHSFSLGFESIGLIINAL
jgi:hypothetical protein